jgi:vancomycin resistance protein VanJ
VKNLSFLNQLIFFINNIFALLYLASFTLPYVPPKSFPLLSIMSLMVPLLIFAHIGFILYWLLAGIKKQVLLSSFCIMLAIGFSFFPYKFNDKTLISGSSFSVMNYNVRIFNKYKWINNEDIPKQISAFINDQNPDLLSLQEYYPDKDLSLNFPYKYEKLIGKKNAIGLGLFSKYRIVNQGSLDFEHSNNNAIFIDIIKNDDTIRVYNVHLESFGIKPDSVDLSLDETKSKKLISRLKSSFTKQQSQVEKFLENKNHCTHKVIICGDFNNTYYSWAYRKLKGDLRDTFLAAGKGFGKTYSFNKYPLRIDFILADKKFNVNQHQNFDVNLSDHEPILARLSN